MNQSVNDADSHQARWARFRFSIVGPLLSSPPEPGELQITLETLAKKSWCHPITGKPVYFSKVTIERWLYQAKNTHDPIKVLQAKRRSDAGQSRKLPVEVKQILQAQYRVHPNWSYQLHLDNLSATLRHESKSTPFPSYSSLYRYMRANGFQKRRVVHTRDTIGAQRAQKRLEERETRSFEMEYVHSLWHLDFHHGSRDIIDKNGQWRKPLLLCILDDHSRMVCHAQWYLDETAESLVHGFKQALQKRGLPRAVMTDNGSAMMSAEFCQGLECLSILHQPTLPYSPHQNGKQEVFWGQVEGRLMAMLEGQAELSLAFLNEATIAWVEFEYHKKIHSEILVTPLERYLKSKNVGRACPETSVLHRTFCAEVKRKQRRTDGTFMLEGCRFEVPAQYRHLETLHVRYTRWNLTQAILVDPNNNACFQILYPQDKLKNGNRQRRMLSQKASEAIKPKSTEVAPLLKELMAEYAASGLPPAYIVKEGDNS